MNGIEKIIDRIQTETNAACMVTSGEASERCAAIRLDAEEKARAAYQALLDAGKQELGQLRAQEDRAAKLDAKKEVLSLKREMIGKAFEMALGKLQGMPKEKMVAFLARLAAEASSTGEEEIIFSEADAAGMGADVVAAANAALAAAGKKAGLRLSDEHRALNGGLVLKKGNVEVNCTIETLLEQKRSELEAKVAGILFQ